MGHECDLCLLGPTLQGRECDLRLLDLGNNNMTSLGAEALSRMLADKRNLQELCLYMNDVGDKGANKVSGGRTEVPTR